MRQDDRYRRRGETPWLTYGIAGLVALLLHLLVVAVVSLATIWDSSAEQEPEEVEIELEFEPEPPPKPPPEVEQVPERAEGAEAENDPVVEDPFAFPSAGEGETKPTRPTGPEDPVKAPPSAGGGEERELENVTPPLEDTEPEPSEEDFEQVPPDEVDEHDLAEPETQPTQSVPPSERPADPPEETQEDPPDAEANDEGVVEPGDTDALRILPKQLPEPLPKKPPPKLPRRPEGQGRNTLDIGDLEGGQWDSTVNFEDPALQRSSYAMEFYFAVYRAWLRELNGRVRRFERDQHAAGASTLDGRVTIRCRIHRDGTITDVQILSRAPLPALDEASSRALTRAVVPPLPLGYPHDETTVTWTFKIHGFYSAQQLERRLRWARQNGMF